MTPSRYLVQGALGSWLLAATAVAAPAPGPVQPPPAAADAPASSDGAVAPAEGTGVGEKASPDRRPEEASVPALKAKLEDGTSVIGRLLQAARRKGDVVAIECLRDKQARAGDVLEVATGELIVLSDAGSGAKAREFALEKLAAAGDRMDKVVEQAKSCGKDVAPEEQENRTRTELDAQRFVPWLDPTTPPAQSPVPPSVNDSHPPVVRSPVG
jgi:hypothetical protein